MSSGAGEIRHVHEDGSSERMRPVQPEHLEEHVLDRFGQRATVADATYLRCPRDGHVIAVVERTA
jgi:hypothetical protein